MVPSKKAKSQKKKAAFNPFEELEGGASAGDDGGGGEDDYNPFADFMEGVGTVVLLSRKASQLRRMIDWTSSKALPGESKLSLT